MKRASTQPMVSQKILTTLILCGAIFFTQWAWPENNVAPEFKKIQALVGDWQGILPDGKAIDISYRKISGGAILEAYHPDDPMWWNMSSVYHADVDKVVMSHYCSWGNHPRMFAHSASDNGKTLAFKFVDLTLTQPNHGYMHDATFYFDDVDHFRHQWIWRENGVDTPLVLHLTRKKTRQE